MNVYVKIPSTNHSHQSSCYKFVGSLTSAGRSFFSPLLLCAFVPLCFFWLFAFFNNSIWPVICWVSSQFSSKVSWLFGWDRRKPYPRKRFKWMYNFFLTDAGVYFPFSTPSWQIYQRSRNISVRERAGDLCLHCGLNKKKKWSQRNTHSCIHTFTFSVYIHEYYTRVTHICIHMHSQLITAIEHAIHQNSELV